jgi:hypothetical protein
MSENQFPYDGKRLKQAVYQTVRPSLTLETRRMVEEARRLASHLSELERWFPDGFKTFADAVRCWASPPAPPTEAEG